MKMEAGPALDKLIHDKVMKAKFPEDHCPVCGWTLADTPEQGCTKNSCSLRPVPRRRADDPPLYSTRLDAAFLIVDHLQRKHGWRFDLLGHEKGYWHAQFFGGPEDETGKRHGDQYAATPALAICAAALQAVEVIRD